MHTYPGSIERQQRLLHGTAVEAGACIRDVSIRPLYGHRNLGVNSISAVQQLPCINSSIHLPLLLSCFTLHRCTTFTWSGAHSIASCFYGFLIVIKLHENLAMNIIGSLARAVIYIRGTQFQQLLCFSKFRCVGSKPVHTSRTRSQYPHPGQWRSETLSLQQGSQSLPLPNVSLVLQMC